jgi:hypothetical protein
MTLFDFEELAEYWTEHPPVHILVAAYLGLGKHQRRQTQRAPVNSGPATRSNLEELLVELGPGFGAGDVHAGLDPVVLDFAELRRRMDPGK